MVTLHDIAQHAGVSPSTVSRAMHGDSSISEKTRCKVLKTAKALDYDNSPSLKDVAALAGVSLSTVSNVLNGRSASEQSRKIVLAAASELNYHQKSVVASINQKTVIFAASNAPMDMIGNIYATAARRGYNVMYMPTDLYPDETYIRYLESDLAAGIIFFNCIKSDLMRLCAKRHPTIQLGLYYDIPGSHVVTIDYEQAAFELATELFNQGKSKIRLLVSRAKTGTLLNRYTDLYLRGASRAVSEQGRPSSSVEIYDLGDYGLVGDFDHHTEHVNNLLVIPDDERPDALLCMNGTLAATYINLLTMAGMRIPDDIAVASFLGGGHDKQCRPYVTSLQPPSKSLGGEAMQAIANLIENTRPIPVTMFFQHQIRFAGSTRQELFPFGMTNQ